ncbi:hypothetical protein PVAP13_8NG176400 [Panicum virgatum]|uniref:Uncharacterized protein n=1 Tax=Panicum virgatum TaxID=38727 RepID=A0A8T0PAV8_PANVG|nr:hypothetical protein PVAP13_8NG176400 [Panicum virgatum]
METMRAEAVADGQPSLPSAEVVSKVLSQNSSNNMFLKNTELDAEKQGSAILHDQLEELNKKSEATEVALERTARQYKEFKKHKEESDLILLTLLNTSARCRMSQP